MTRAIIFLLALAVGPARADEAADDAKFGEGSGTDHATRNAPDPDIEGKTYKAENCGSDGCNAIFEFAQARLIQYFYQPGQMAVRGVLVKIRATPLNCPDCAAYRLIQFVWDYTNVDGKKIATKPEDPRELRRSGWFGGQPSKGWMIDRGGSTTQDQKGDEPFGGPGYSDGGNGKPAIDRDPPGFRDADRNVGREFFTCLVCGDKLLACVHWGFYTDANGVTTFDPKPPVAACGMPPEARDALKRWDGKPHGIKVP